MLKLNFSKILRYTIHVKIFNDSFWLQGAYNVMFVLHEWSFLVVCFYVSLFWSNPFRSSWYDVNRSVVIPAYVTIIILTLFDECKCLEWHPRRRVSLRIRFSDVHFEERP